jgi:hypothetical protein
VSCCSAYGSWLVAVEMSRVVWWQSLEIHLRAARVLEESADLLNSSGDVASAIRASEFAATEREAYAALLPRHPEWGTDGP